MKPLIKIPDVLIILLSACLTFFSAYSVYIKPESSSQVLIRGHNREWTFQIGANETVIVSGPLGNTVVHIGGNRAWVESSPCENQTCVAAGFIAKQGQWAACLPNNVLILIQGTPRRAGTGDENADVVAW
jgi:hypothetical protein